MKNWELLNFYIKFPSKLVAEGGGGGSIALWLGYLLTGPAAQGLMPKGKKLLMLFKLINTIAKRKVDSGLKMLIEPI